MEGFRGIKPAFKWIAKDSSIELSDDDYVATKTTPDPGVYPSYRSLMSSSPLVPGYRYMVGLKFSSLNYIKVGLCTSNDPQNFSKAFSDTDQGWALLLNEKTLRHSSNSEGKAYPFESTSSEIVLYYDTIAGTLSFGTEFENFGVAFECEAFKTQPMYVAVAMKSLKSSVELIYRFPPTWKQRLYVLWGTSKQLPIKHLSRLPGHIVREIIMMI